MDDKHFQKLEKMYLSANINTMIFDTTTCKILDGYAEIGLTISEKYFHGLGAIHGSVYFKLLDDAAFFAANSKSKFFILTTAFNLHFLRPVKKGKIRAIGNLKYNSCFIQSFVKRNFRLELMRGLGKGVKEFKDATKNEEESDTKE